MTHGRRRLGQEWLAVDGGEARTTSERSPWLAGDSQKKLHMIPEELVEKLTSRDRFVIVV